MVTYQTDEGAVLPVDPAARTFTWSESSSSFRGGTSFRVTAEDCAGNRTTTAAVQEGFGIYDDQDPPITYTGGWQVGTFPDFLEGHTHYSTRRGARASITVKGGPLALLMERRGDRGAVDVLLDGKKVATVDTRADRTIHASVVWQTLLPPGGTHVLTIVNKATPGRPRVDLDAVLVGSY